MAPARAKSTGEKVEKYRDTSVGSRGVKRRAIVPEM